MPLGKDEGRCNDMAQIVLFHYFPKTLLARHGRTGEADLYDIVQCGDLFGAKYPQLHYSYCGNLDNPIGSQTAFITLLRT